MFRIINNSYFTKWVLTTCVAMLTLAGPGRLAIFTVAAAGGSPYVLTTHSRLIDTYLLLACTLATQRFFRWRWIESLIISYTVVWPVANSSSAGWVMLLTSGCAMLCGTFISQMNPAHATNTLQIICSQFLLLQWFSVALQAEQFYSPGVGVRFGGFWQTPEMIYPFALVLLTCTLLNQGETRMQNQSAALTQAFLLLAVVSLSATGSRSAIFAGLGVVVWCIKSGKRNTTIGLCLVLLTAGLIRRIWNLEALESTMAASAPRIDMFELYQEAVSRQWFFGNGLNSFVRMQLESGEPLGRYSLIAVPNNFLNIASDYGLIWLGCFASIAIYGSRRALRIPGTRSVVCGLCILAVPMLTETIINSTYLMLPVNVLVCFGAGLLLGAIIHIRPVKSQPVFLGRVGSASS